jgi:hypothetical protein
MATKKLTDADKAKRAAERAAAKNALKAAASGDQEQMQKAAADMAGHAPVDLTAAPGGNRTVAVACKIPHGIIIQAYSKVTEHEDVMGGGKRAVDRYRPAGQQYRIHGTLTPNKQRARHVRDNSGGFAITEGIPLAVWEDFARHNEHSAFMTNSLLFGDENLDRVLGWAREHKDVRTNFERLDVSLVPDAQGVKRIKDPRVRRVAPQITDGEVEIGAA